MDAKDWVMAVLSLAGIIISLFSLKNSSKASSIAANAASSAANASSSALSVQHASVELEIRNAIEGAKYNIQTLSSSFAPLKVGHEKGTLSENEEAVYQIHLKTLDSMIESMLNQYDDACAKYLDGKIDKARFRKTYHKEIANIVENAEFKEYFDPTTSRYKPILMVYKEWFDYEKAK